MSRNTKRMSDDLRVDRLPGVGTRYEIGTIDGQRLTVVIDRHGDRHLSLRPGRHVGDPGASAVLSARQSSLLALILSNTLEMAETELADVVVAA
jgi:K+/H+ antiporter YhaU regulatory subunit KhtT